jgi:hypothetical protein
MATRLPLVLGADGLPQQLQSGDSLPNQGSTGTSALTEYTTDPSPATLGVPYIKVSPSTTPQIDPLLTMFFGGLPIQNLVAGPNTYALSVMTSGGIKRTALT